MSDDKSTDFFAEQSGEEPQVAEEPKSDEPELIKVGDREFTQGEFDHMVELRAKVEDIESKGGQSIDHVMKSWGDRGNRISELEKQISDRESQELQTKATTQGYQNLSQEESDRLAIAELERLGYSSKEQVRSDIAQEVKALNYINEVGGFIKDQTGAGKPDVGEEELLQYMVRKGHNEDDYEKAYKEMFNSQVKVWEEEQLSSQKQPGMVTETTSTAGAKQPEVKSFRGMKTDELMKVVDRALG